MRLFLPLISLALAGCLSAPAPGGSIDSGIYGVAMIGPMCPVARDPPDPDCADRPFEGNFTVSPANETRVLATFSSDTSGAFNVTLPPGEYVIRLAKESQTPPICGTSAPTRVVAGVWTEITMQCDSGIR